MKRCSGMKALFFALFLLVGCFSRSAYGAEKFSDVPSGHWAQSYINSIRELGVTSGIGNNEFGFGRQITRAEFVTFLANLMKCDVSSASNGHFSDNNDSGAWYYKAVAITGAKDIADVEAGNFRPNDAITREEMAVMLINSLGYKALANRLNYLPAPFVDVSANTGYITMAKDFGIISGISADKFAPEQTATKEQAAAMMMRMYEIRLNKLKEINAFYAISSYSQLNLAENANSISFGWSRLETDGSSVWLNASAENNNEYKLPDGYGDVWNSAAVSGKNKLLMVAVKDEDSAAIINTPQLNGQAVDEISAILLNGGDGGALKFDGVVLDFETLKGADTRNNYSEFVRRVKAAIGDKLLYVAVHPQRRAGHEYYNGYDYRALGDVADKIILMAHDYNAKSLTQTEMESGIVMTPVAPIDEVYYALSAISDAQTGVADKSKIMLQINFATAQWKTQDGVVINQKPYTPAYSAVIKRIKSGAKVNFDEATQSPYITFVNNDDGTNNIVWYENARSVKAKINLANMFGIEGLSLWRLGNIPEHGDGFDVMETILQARGR